MAPWHHGTMAPWREASEMTPERFFKEVACQAPPIIIEARGDGIGLNMASRGVLEMCGDFDVRKGWMKEKLDEILDDTCLICIFLVVS